MENLKVLSFREVVDPDLDVVMDDPGDGDTLFIPVGIARASIVVAAENDLDARRPAANGRADDNLADQVVE